MLEHARTSVLTPNGLLEVKKKKPKNTRKPFKTPVFLFFCFSKDALRADRTQKSLPSSRHPLLEGTLPLGVNCSILTPDSLLIGKAGGKVVFCYRSL